jgi:hypothetical protein
MAQHQMLQLLVECLLLMEAPHRRLVLTNWFANKQY